MSALWSEVLVDYEWEVDRCLRCGLVLGTINATDHLWWVGHGPGKGSTWVVSFLYARPLLDSTTPDPRLSAAGSFEGMCLQCRHYLSPPAVQWAPATRGFSLEHLLTDGPQGQGILSSTNSLCITILYCSSIAHSPIDRIILPSLTLLVAFLLW